ncbi:5-methyltetrahydrofolate--homocysteine methyltransferase [Treponema rectale]|uniref:Methionine synthase n=1 Tax=Treponema rectale TaxID=744512 RepID=A0A840S9T9_9SPIR|nr:homocysteine S-methyltransferase family protein [Treponema rectale]MBB5219459.1 5-methyltetrahydrofolate--homocysteine methyltransferase [Treponema rectale]
MNRELTFREFLSQSVKEKKFIFFDGGIGTMIQKYPAVSYQIPEDLNFYHPEIIKEIHTLYLEAGANVLTANSFGANKKKLEGENARWSAAEYIKESLKLQKEAVEEFKKAHPDDDTPRFISWDSGQIGKLLEPMGPLTFDEAYEAYKDAAVTAEKNGAQIAILETMSDLYEVKAAILAIQENTNLPIAATMTFQDTLRTLTGADVLTCVTYLESLHPDIIGFNCGGSLEEDKKLAELFTKYSHLPVLVQPNAGLPENINGKDVFKVEPEEFAEIQREIAGTGAMILGGCCGTTPAHIKCMIGKLNGITFTKAEHEEQGNTYLCSYNSTVQVGKNAGPKIIGERINPTGKKKCKEALQNKDMQFILDEAESQINAGAHILDVNVGLPGIDEKEMMCLAVKTIQSTFSIPLQLDSSEPPVLEKALRYYNGKALVNSVNGKQEVMDKVFPLIKKYGGAVTALCIDEEGIAPVAEGRVAVADKIIREAAKYGIPVRDIFIDTLTLTVSSEQKTALETVRAIRMLKEKYGKDGIQFVLGVSNISFGLPRRDIVNSRFFTLALDAGLSAAIINPGAQSMMDTYRAYRSLACFDDNCLDYIQTYTGTLDPTTAKAKEKIIVDAVNDGTISLSLNLGGSAPSH